MRNNLMRKTAVLATVVAIGATTAIAGAGDADARRLPNGFKQSTGIDGQVATIRRTGESARVMRSVANNGAGRAAAVSGTYKATLSKGKGVMTVGYLVGCQVDITGLEGGLSGTIGLTSSLSGSLSIPLAPGQVARVTSDDIVISKGKATVLIDNFQLDVQQCGGQATARSMVQVIAADGLAAEDGAISGDSGYLQSTLYGRPFSLG